MKIMKKITKNSWRRLCSIILTLIIVLGTVTNAIAEWQEMKQSRNVYLNEIWVEQKQCINFYENGEWIRNIAGEGHILWINGNIILYNLYATGYWCYDQYGNCFAINTDSKVMLCKRGTNTFLVDNSITGCTGFIRDGNKIGLLLETNHGNYRLSDLLNGTVGNTNLGTTITSNAPYSYDDIVTRRGDIYYYNYRGGEYSYNVLGNKLYCGLDIIEYDVEKFGFSYGYVIYVVKSNPSVVYRLPIGKTSEAKQIGRKFESFIYDSSGWIVSVQLEGKTVNVNSDYANNSNNNNYNYNYDYGYEYPYVKISGNYYYYYASKSKYYQYYLKNSILYYDDEKLETSVKEITFSDEGYIIYATNSGYVYAYPVGEISSSYRKYIGKYFDYFDDDDYMSNGYRDKYDDYVDFDF